MGGPLWPLIPFLPGRLKFMDRVTIQDVGTALAMLAAKGESLSESSMRKSRALPAGWSVGFDERDVETEQGGGSQGTGNRKCRQQTKPKPEPPRHISTLPCLQCGVPNT